MMDITISSANGGVVILLAALVIVLAFVVGSSFVAGKNAAKDEATAFFNSTQRRVKYIVKMDAGKEVSTTLTFLITGGSIRLNTTGNDNSLCVVQDGLVTIEENRTLSEPYRYKSTLQDA